MPKNVPPPAGRSKIRVFFVDADLAPGDMQQLTETLTNAIRPTHMLTRVASPRLSAPVEGKAQEDGEIEDTPIEEFAEDASHNGEEVTARAPSKPRTYRKPKPVTDLDMKAGGKPFTEFAAEKAPEDHLNRYLVAAAWLHDFAKIPTITTDHIFTCYKAAEWTFDVKDTTFPFRSLKADGYGSIPSKGAFSINHLGLARVEKMKRPVA